MESITQQPFDANILSPNPYEQKPLLTTRQSAKGLLLPSRKGKKEDLLQSKYDTRLADAALRQAAEGGYLVSPSRAFLLERCKTADQQNRSLNQIEYIHLSHFHIRTLGHIQSCRHLAVCILHNNYLTRFNALENCPYLIRLDLHSNQIAKLPDEHFWGQMQNLQILNLHDNGIGKLESIQALSGCPNLNALTLYNTPLSLKNNYRHHTVNSIWSLKALDHHVIGDDEIIEDAIFTKRFCAMNPRLYVDLCPRETESVHLRTIEMEMKVVLKIMSNINQRLVHGSPVVVMQRWIRGHLCRRKRNISYFEVSERLRKLNFTRHGTMSGSHPGEAYSLDYDTYLKNRRPGSKTPSASTTLRADTPTLKTSTDEPKEDDFDFKLLPTKLHINLAKLEQNALRSFDNSPDQSVPIDVHKDMSFLSKSLFSKSFSLRFEKDVKVEKIKQPPAPACTPATAPFKLGRRDPLTVQQMLGPMETLVHEIPTLSHPTFGTLVEGGTKERREIGVQCEQDDDVPNHEWRIHNRSFQVAGGRPAVVELDPMQERLIMNREAGRDVREAVEYWHEQDFQKSKPQAVKTKPPPRLKDHVSLATLVAVSKAYRDRDRTDNVAAKVDRVMKIQRERMQSKHIVAAFKDERRSLALSQRQEDRIHMTEAMQQTDASKAAYLEYAQDRKERALQRHRTRHTELMFATDFGNQHMSVSNALIRHDRQATKEDVTTEKGEIVNRIKVQLTEQAELVRRYMEHKQLMRQMAGSSEKSRIDTRILQEANERVMRTRQRVAGIKARKAAIQSYQHSLPTTANPGAWPLVMSRNIAPEPSGSPDQPALPDVVEPRLDDGTLEQGASSNPAQDSSIVALPPVPPYPSVTEDYASPQVALPSPVTLQT